MIRCFLSQTYPNKEVLILADGEDVRDLVPNDDDSIRLVHIEEGRTVGEKRNFGVSRACGEIIAHFDDDDWSAPARLADQIERLQRTGKSVTGYSSMFFTDGLRWWRYEGRNNYAIGTSLCYRKSWWQDHPFLAMQVGEDGEFVIEARQCQQLETSPAGEIMIATIHRGNTSPRQLSGAQWISLPGFAGVPGVEIA